MGDMTPVLIEVSVEKLFNIWKATYNGKLFLNGDGGAEKIAKLNRVTAWLIDCDEVWAPIIDLRVDDPTRLFFADGRHTFTALKNLGYIRIDIVVPKTKAEVLSNTLGVLD
jgi:hypothetical protein